MSDIFISNSREDSEQALKLAERLQGEGMSVWIDQRGIEAAKSWSGEIVDAIEVSKAFVLLLSSHSIESGNLEKEYERDWRRLSNHLSDILLTMQLE